MNWLKQKAGQMAGIAQKAIYAIVSLVVLFLLYANLVPEAQSAGNTLNASGVPLGSLFASGGVIFVIMMVGLLIVGINMFMKKK